MFGVSLNWNNLGMVKQMMKIGEVFVEDDIFVNFLFDVLDFDVGFDDQIDSFCGVLKSDVEGGLLDFGDGGGFDFDVGGVGGMGDVDLLQFGGGFGGGMDVGFGGGLFVMSYMVGSVLYVNFDFIMDILIDVQIVLGNSYMYVVMLMNLIEGVIIVFDCKIGDLVEVVVNGCQIGCGEIMVFDEDNICFGI